VQSFVERGGRHFAWVAEGARLIRKEVKIGKSNDQVTEIVSGLAEGEKVVQTPRTVIPKEIVQLEEDVPATIESGTSGLKTPEPGQRGGGPPGEGGKRGGRGGGRGERGSPGESAAGPGAGGLATEGQPTGGGRGEGGQFGGGGRGGGGRGGGDPLAFFQRMDQNGDGKVTEDEMPEFMKGRFAAMDTNGDKAIDKDEWQKAAAAFQAGGGSGGPPGGGRPDAGGGQ
jgi:hypothetical protein